MCTLSCRGWKEIACKCHLEESLLTLHCSLESQELLCWTLQLLNRARAQQGIGKWAGETGEGAWLWGAEKKAAEVVSYTCRDQMEEARWIPD